MRLPIASSIESRDGSLTKDAKLVNCFVDVEGETSFVVKRPGLRKSVASAAGAGLGMVSWEGNMYHATGLTFYQTSYASIPSGTSGGPSVSSSKVFSNTTPYIDNIFSDGTNLKSVQWDNSSPITRTSSNGGITWSNIVSSSSVNLMNNSASSGASMVYLSGKIYAFIGGGVSITSDSGVTWTSNITTYWQTVTYVPIMSDGSKLISIKNNTSGGSYGIYTSTNGTTWTLFSPFDPTGTAFSNLSHAIYANGKVYAVDQQCRSISESSDLINWTTHSISTSTTYSQPFLMYDNGALIVSKYDPVSGMVNFHIIDTTAWTLGPSDGNTGTNMSAYLSLKNASCSVGGSAFILYQDSNSGNSEIFKLDAVGGSSFVAPPYSYSFTTATGGLPLSWVGTSPGTYTKKMFIKNTEKAWTLTLGTPGTLTQVSDPDYPAVTVPGAVYLDGYFFVMDKDGTVYNCDLENPDSWNALNYITAEAEWDKGVAIAKHQNYVVALKDWTCELFYDAANPVASPLSKVANATIQIGCAQGYSAVQFHGGLIFVSKTRERGRSVHFFASNSIEPQEIASASIQRVLNAADLTTVRAWGGKVGGRILYVLNLVTANITLVYDFTSQTWAQWTSDNTGTEGYFKYGFYATDGNRDFLLHETTGEVFTFTPDVYQDNGADIKVLIRSGRLDSGNMDRKTMSALTVVGDKAATSVSVQYSDDDYQTFSAARTVAMDSEPPRLSRLGMFRRRSFDIRHVDNTPLRLAAIDAEIKQAR